MMQSLAVVLTLHDNLVMVTITNYRKAQTRVTKALYLYCSGGKKAKPFSGECNEYEEKNQMKL